MDLRPDDHCTPGALTHEPTCPHCVHVEHGPLSCDWCLCDDTSRPGIY